MSSLCPADLAQHHQCARPCLPSARFLPRGVGPELLAWKQKLSLNLEHRKMIPGWERAKYSWSQVGAAMIPGTGAMEWGLFA